MGTSLYDRYLQEQGAGGLHTKPPKESLYDQYLRETGGDYTGRAVEASVAPPATPPKRRASTVEELPTPIRALGQFGRGTAESATSLGRVAGMVPGLGGVGRASKQAEEWLDEAYGDPSGFWENAARFTGRLAGEALQAMTGGKLATMGVKAVAQGATKAAPAASALAKALEGGSGTLKQAGAISAVNAPIDVVQGLKEDQGLLLPGKAGSVAENLLFSGAASALTARSAARAAKAAGEAKSAQQAARTADEVAPQTERIGSGQPMLALPAPQQGPKPLVPSAGAATEIPDDLDVVVRNVVEQWMDGATLGEVRDNLRALGLTQTDPAAYLRKAGVALPEGQTSYFRLTPQERLAVGPTERGGRGWFVPGQEAPTRPWSVVPQTGAPQTNPAIPMGGGAAWEKIKQQASDSKRKFWEQLDDYGLVLFDRETGQPFSAVSLVHQRDAQHPLYEQAKEAMRRFRLRSAPNIVGRGDRKHPLYKLASSAVDYTARAQAMDPDLRMGFIPRGMQPPAPFSKTTQDVPLASPPQPSQLSQRTLNRLGPPKRQSAGRGQPVLTKLPKGEWEVSIGNRAVRVMRNVGDKGWYMVDNDTGELLQGARGQAGERMPRFVHVGDTKEEMLQNVATSIRQREKLIAQANRQIARAKPQVARNADRSVSLTLRGKTVRLSRDAKGKRWFMEDPMDPGAQTFAGKTRTEAEAQATAYLRKSMRVGAVDAQLLSTVGGAGVGGMAGMAMADEEATLQDRLLLGAAGAAAGAGLGAGAVRALRAAPTIAQKTTPAMDSFLRGVARGERGGMSPMRRTIRDRLTSLRTNLVEETLPLVKAAEVGGRKQEMQEAIAASHGVGQASKQFMKDALKPILDVVTPERDDAFRAYVLARRDLDLRSRGAAPKSGRTVAELQQIVADGEAMGLREASDYLTRVYRGLLDFRRASGLISDADYANIVKSEDYYVPFAREFAQEQAIKGSSGRRFTRSSSGVRGMNKDEMALADFADPLEVAVQSIERTFRDVSKQRVANIIGELADIGSLPSVRRIPAGAKPGLNAKVFRQMRDGKVELYEVTDPELYDAITSTGDVSGNILTTIAQRFKRLKQMGITLMPDFSALANPMRDVVLSAAQRPDTRRAATEMAIGAGVGGAMGADMDEENALRGLLVGAGLGAGAGGLARPLLQTLRGVADVVGESDVYKEFVRNGGITEGFFVRDPKDARKALEELRRTGVKPSDILIPKRWVDALRYIGSVGEQATRVAAYKEVRKAGAGIGEAIVEAQDRTLRFANVGRSTKWVSSVQAFWNAKVQGWDKLGRMLKSPKTWGLGAGVMTAPSVSLWMANKDNPEYWQRPLWERNTFWLVPKEDGGFYRIPKPFEIGYLFASAPERLLDFAAQKGLIESAAFTTADPSRSLARSVRDITGSSVKGIVPFPDILSTIAQLSSNKDSFRNTPIERNTALPKAMRENEETSGVARALGSRFASPSQIDFAIQQATGTMGGAALSAADVALRAMGKDAPAPRAGVPLLTRRFVTNPAVMSEAESAAADRLNQAEEAHRGLQALLQQGDTERAAQFQADNAAALQDYAVLSPLRSALRKAEGMRRDVRRARAMPNDQREALLKALRSQSRAVSERVLSTPMLSR